MGKGVGRGVQGGREKMILIVLNFGNMVCFVEPA